MVPEERAGREAWQVPEQGEGAGGKTPDSCSMALLGKGRAVKGIVLCLPAPLLLSVSASCSLEASSVGFPRSGGATILPHAPTQLKSCSQCFPMSPCLTQPHKLPSCSGFSCRDIPGEIPVPLQKYRVPSCEGLQSYTHAQTQAPNAVRKRITFD